MLVTGATGGIGSCLVQMFAKEGATLGIHYHQNQEQAKSLSRNIEVDGGREGCFQADLLSTNELSLVQEFHRLLGKRLYIQVWILDLRGVEKLKLQLQEKWLRQPTILGWEISFGLIMDMELKRPTDTCRKCL